jgi:hypothetical protein
MESTRRRGIKLRSTFSVRPHDCSEPREYHDTATYRPLTLAAHETAGHDVDTLQEPDAAQENKNCAHDAHADSHGPPIKLAKISAFAERFLALFGITNTSTCSPEGERYKIRFAARAA